MTPVQIELRLSTPAWSRDYREQARTLLEAWPELICEIHHIGSTAVPGLIAKPIIDIVIAVWRIQSADELVKLGYVNMGEYGIPGRRYFRKPGEEGDKFHLHVDQCGSRHIRRHLRFRDYLIAHPRAAQAYVEHKQELAGTYWESTSDYAEAKTAFIRKMEGRARAWQRGEAERS